MYSVFSILCRKSNVLNFEYIEYGKALAYHIVERTYRMHD